MPQYVVDELLAAEGVTRVDYLVTDSGPLLSEALASGQVDFAMTFSGPLALELDRGRKITMLADVHVGCFELFAKDGINSVADLKVAYRLACERMGARHSRSQDRDVVIRALPEEEIPRKRMKANF
jgi:ABC-type nitrate/sulfonate/bicarbonate transport system substrate-binding protein